MARRLSEGKLRGALAGALALAAIGVGAAPALAGGGGGTGPGGPGGGNGGNRGALAGQGMWIWYVSQSNNGNVASIAKKARAHGIGTVFVKSSDGRSAWSQFNPRLVHALHARGLKVCAWQYVYGVHPRTEARLGAKAKADGADCLAIDAESDYEGLYRSASAYMHRLRGLVGPHYPIALASFPYVDYHPALPYSVFLGPHGAQFNVPQVYWHAIGTSPGAALAHTFEFNRVYKRRLRPLGQTYGGPPLKEVEAFRRYSISYGFKGYSWWSWQSTAPSEWRVLARNASRIQGFRKPKLYPQLHVGSAGDLVVWAQEHLAGAGEKLPISGRFRGKTRSAVINFQSRKGISRTGTIGPTTWRALLAVKPVAVDWRHPRRTLTKAADPAGGEPSSASLPAVRDEIPDHPPLG